ncbi:MAG TPA: YjgP/YjgQ family permease, partial [Caldithrix abyssi]|nr:YjgP/YjgQ family permease [Caldithrix abyssi]
MIKTKILTRYIIKEHIGPFFMSLGVIMFILLMNFLVKYIGQIFGKGLSAWTIVKLIAYNTGWMLALAVPMATLVAVLMAYGRFSADNEITILKSSGISIYRIMLPSLYLGVLLTVGMIYFNDRILPETNHRAKLLFQAIREKKPTLDLEEHIFYEIGNYTFVVGHIEKPLTDEWLDISGVLGPEYRTHKETDRLRDILIFDRSDPRVDVTITADEGYMIYSQPRKSLIFTLFNGEYHQYETRKPDEYQRSDFSRQVVIIPAKEFAFEERNNSYRSDREMSIKMMKQKVAYFKNRIRERNKKIAHAVEVNFKSTQELLTRSAELNGDSLAKAVKTTDLSEEKNLIALRKAKNQVEGHFNQMRMHKSFLVNQQKSINKFMVEIYKKVSIPFACLVFILIGAPLGIMSRKGSMGTAISLSIGFFLFSWVFLIGGEDLADRRYLTPFMAMWAANII